MAIDVMKPDFARNIRHALAGAAVGRVTGRGKP